MKSVISFPNLFGGFEVSVSRVAFSVFGVDIYWYGLIIGFAFCIAVILVLRDAKKFNMNEDDIVNIMLFAVPIGIIFARLFYVVFFVDSSWSFKEIINIRDGGLAIYGGLIGGIATAMIYCKIKKLRFLELADLIVPYVALAQAIGRWGNFFNQEAFGINTALPWGMTSQSISNQLTILGSFNGVQLYPDIPVHPTFLYESIWSFSVFLLLFLIRKNKKFTGQIFCLYMMLYGFGRMFIEGLRIDSLLIGSIRANQVIGFIFFLIFGIITLIISLGEKKRKDVIIDQEYENTGTSEFASILKTKDQLEETEKISEEEIELEQKNEKKE
ncbi:MAG: prolipoprotein diacylglyceryl transferase [Clostridia bacterium]|nr:prolipoprotein diacylglyceryl transferase [Clostridia bacterium]